MIKLNLETKSREQELIKAYLEENASQMLADKINNGVPADKDGKPLISKKDLSGFLSFASEEARKLADKNASSACIEDKTVYGWAIHYFEEDSIQGKLFNLDGTEYLPTPKVKPTIQRTTTEPKIIKEEKPQLSFFDLGMEIEKDITPTPSIEQNIPDEIENAINGEYVTEDGEIIHYEAFDGDMEEEVKEEPKPDFNPVGTPLYQKYMYIQKQYPTAILTMRLGDFYEFLGENAKTVATVLDLTLTGRDCGLSERVPMCGIPYHAADNYFNKITKNHDLVVVEDMEDIRLIHKQELQTKTLSTDNVQIKCLIELFGKDLEVK